MESLKSMWQGMSDMNKSLVKILFGIVCALGVMFLVVLIIRLTRGGTDNYSKIENTLQKAASRYYKKNKDELPENGEEQTVAVDTLVSAEYMKPLEDYVKKGVTCSGNVTVVNNNNQYTYIPFLDCEDEYTTKMLADSITSDNMIVDEGSGLYLDEEDNFVFRGEYVNNYVEFAGMTWRIVKVNADGSVRLFLAAPNKKHKNSKWDDRYNVDRDSNVGINNYAVSRVRETLNVVYNDDEIFNESNRALIKPQVLCVGARSQDSTDLSDAEECSETLEGDYIGLLQLNEYLQASIDENCDSTLNHSCSNYNYLADVGKTYWTITPVAEDTYHNYRISKYPFVARTANTSNILYTINITGKAALEDGNGSKENPYIIKGERVKK